jgi:hypothetical protein
VLDATHSGATIVPGRIIELGHTACARKAKMSVVYSQWRDRLRAAGVHLALSALVAGLAGALVLGLWYPEPFRAISGGRELFTLIVSVDVIMGPMLTFAVFNRRKPRVELIRDLSVVAVLQLCALGYGLATVWVARPAFVVFAADRFQVVAAIDLNPEELAQAPTEFQHAPWWGPVWVAAEPLTDRVERSRAIEVALASGVDLGTRPVHWRPYQTQTAAVLARAKPLADWVSAHPAEVHAVVKRSELGLEQLVYLPIVARRPGWVVVMSKADAQPVGYLPFGGF